MNDQQPDAGAAPAPEAPQAADVVAAAAEAVPEAEPQAEAPQAVDVVAAAAEAVPEAGPQAVESVAAPVAAAAVVAAAVPPSPPVAPPAPVPSAAAPVPPTDPGWAAYVPAATQSAGPAPGFEYAGFWIRAFAYIIDGIILGIVTSILWFVVLAIFGAIGLGAVASSAGADGTLTEEQVAGLAVGFAMAITVLAFMSILVTFFYFTLFWVKRGATFGQSALGIRIARASDGGPIGWGAAIVRYIMLLIGFAIFYLGVIWVAFEPRKRGWHDMAAGTLAVRRV
jgi:uncharacterized RDD family membrane protein YckC